VQAHTIEAPLDDDWPAILDIANASLEGVPDYSPQDDWLSSRRAFVDEGGVQRHFIVREPGSGRPLGYGAVERAVAAPAGAFRVFVVTALHDRATIGSALFDRALEELRDLGAKSAWFREYASDTHFLSFVRDRGFEESRRFDWRGTELVIMERDLD
jgi:GNAT superfamily N-acetyltransferase